jgi:Sugar (and other) transporter
MPVILIFLVMTVMPESPRWLVSKERSNEARAVLKQVYPAGYNVEPLLDDIKESLLRDQAAEKGYGWSIIFHPSPAFQRMLLVGVGMAVAQQGKSKVHSRRLKCVTYFFALLISLNLFSYRDRCDPILPS